MSSNIISETQPQIAQLELLFAGPLVKDSMVEVLTDLINLNPLFNYTHRLVWVKSEKANFYLDNGDGTSLINWKKQIGRVVVDVYDPTQTYQRKDTVYFSGKIYSALQNVPTNTNPLDNESYWLVIAGETETARYLFTNTSSVLIYTEIRNPIFEIIIGDFVFNEDGTIKLNDETGLAELSNKEIIDAFVIQREDLENNNGVAYQVIFEENSVPVLLTGCVNIK